MNRTFLSLAAVLLCLPCTASGQTHDLEARLRPYLAPPDLVMRHQRRLNITAEQRDFISQKVSELQGEVFDLQWQLEDIGQMLVDAVKTSPVDVDAAMTQFDRMVEIETSIKRNHIRMLLEIRNTLTSEQTQVLQELMEEAAFREGSEEEFRRQQEQQHRNPGR